MLAEWNRFAILGGKERRAAHAIELKGKRRAVFLLKVAHIPRVVNSLLVERYYLQALKKQLHWRLSCEVHCDS